MQLVLECNESANPTVSKVIAFMVRDERGHHLGWLDYDGVKKAMEHFEMKQQRFEEFKMPIKTASQR